MRQRSARRTAILLPALCLAFALSLACGSGSGNNKGTALRNLHPPQNAPTATVPVVLPTPVAASSVPGSGAGANGPAPDTYVVKAGDTLGAIASQLGVSVQALVQANGITDPARIQVGQQLRIPRPGQTPTAGATPAPGTTPALSPVGPAPTAASGPVAIPPTGGAPSGNGTPAAGASPSAGGTPGVSATEYTVKAGDTACSIARAHDISVAELAQANNMSTAQIARLSINQLLKLPPPSGHRDC